MRAKTTFDCFIASHSKEDFEDYYFSHSKEETQQYFNVGSTVFQRLLKYYGTVKPKSCITQLRYQTNMNKYGVDNLFRDTTCMREGYIKVCGSLEEHYKQKAQRQEQTILSTYGSWAKFHESFDEQRQQTCIQKYGSRYFSSSTVGQQKMQEGKIQKHGSLSYHNVEQMKATNLRRWGVEYNFESSNPSINGRGTYHQKLKDDAEFKQQVIEKRKTTCEQIFGSDYYYRQIEKMIQARESRAQSKVNIGFCNYLLSIGIFPEKEFLLDPYVYDFKLGQTLVEIDPYPTHNSTWGIYGNPKAIDYHRKKTLRALEEGYRCVHIFDWIDVPELMYHIVNKKFDLVDCGEPKKHVYNPKLHQVVDAETEDTVTIYDDGFEVIYNGAKD